MFAYSGRKLDTSKWMSEPITERSILEEVNLLVHIWGFYIGKPVYKELKVQGTGSCTFLRICQI